MNSNTICLLCFFISLSFSCTNPQVHLTKSDQGDKLIYPVKTDFTIDLESNPSTGFKWEVLKLDSTILQFKQRTFTAIDSTPGSGGIEHLTFRTIRKGESLLKLGYLRSFEGIGSIEDSFLVYVRIK